MKIWSGLPYRRIGMMLLEFDRRTGAIFRGYNAGLRIAGLAYDIWAVLLRSRELGSAREWIEQYRLDCVIAWKNVQEIALTGNSDPDSRKNRFAGFNVFPGDQLHAGINQNARKIGAAAGFADWHASPQ